MLSRFTIAALALAAALCPAVAAAGLTHAQAVAAARDAAPMLRAQAATLAGARSAVVAAGTLPDPRLTVGIENVPVQGPDRWRTVRDPATEQRVVLMQEMPNLAKREARVAVGQARIERERAMLAATAVQVRRDASLAWLALHFAQRREALIAGLRGENRLLQDSLAARIAAMSAMPADLTMARQDALMLDDRADELARDAARARAELRRWVGARADEPLEGEPQLPAFDAAALRAGLSRSAELAALERMRAIAQAEVGELDAERRGDIAWELAYARRPRYDDMVSLAVSIDLPWQRERRQQPLVDAKRRELERIDAERDDLARRLALEADTMLAELAAMDSMHARLSGTGARLADERVELLVAGWRSGRGDLSQVLAARRAVLDLRIKLIELEAQRAAMRVRLAALTESE